MAAAHKGRRDVIIYEALYVRNSPVNVIYKKERVRRNVKYHQQSKIFKLSKMVFKGVKIKLKRSKELLFFRFVVRIRVGSNPPVIFKEVSTLRGRIVELWWQHNGSLL